jgi:hypothetical protein
MVASITPMLPDAVKTIAIARVQRFAMYVTYKAPVLEFVPLLLGVTHVKFKLGVKKFSLLQKTSFSGSTFNCGALCLVDQCFCF